MATRFLYVAVILWTFKGCQALLENSCVELASSVPDHLSTWVLGLLTLEAVSFSALGQGQPLTQLQMPYWKNIWQTITASALGLAVLGTTCISLFLSMIHTLSSDSAGCDALRVLWAATPVVIGTAGAGTILLVAFASWIAGHDVAVKNRGSQRRSKQRYYIHPVDTYGIGLLALREKLLWYLLTSIWIAGLTISILITIRGDVLNGLLSASGIIAVWSNTWLPEWNASKTGRGEDTLTRNTVDHSCIELNVMGDNFEQVAYFIQQQKRASWWRGSENVQNSRLTYRCRIYVLANAHASATDFKGESFVLETYNSAADDLGELATKILDQAEAFRDRIYAGLANLDSSNLEHRGCFAALVASVLCPDLWGEMKNQRFRLRATAIAQSWLTRLRRSAGGQMDFLDASQQNSHNGHQCLCPIHRWSRRRTLESTVQKEAKYLLGPDVSIPAIKVEHKDFAKQLWDAIRTREGAQHLNSAALLSIYIFALQTRGAIDITDVN